MSGREPSPADDASGEALTDAVTAADLVRLLETERDLPPSQRTTRAPDVSLEGAIDRLHRIERRRAEGSSHRMLAAELAHLVTDSWSWQAELTSEVLRYAQDPGRAGEATGP